MMIILNIIAIVCYFFESIYFCSSFLPNADQVQKQKLYNILLGINTFEFGAFVRFANVENISLSDLDKINVTALYEQVCI